MQFPFVTSAYAAILALLFVALSVWVMAGRTRYGTVHGDGGQADLARRIRSHGNFAEYVPLVLLLAALFEAAGGGRFATHALLAPLTLARAAHPFGMTAPANSPRQYVCRGASALVTLLAMTGGAILLLVRIS